MSPRADFDDLVALAMARADHAHMRPAIEKELLHYDILYALDRERLLAGLTFQGGTALRLCYGASRLSEDLDFVGGRGFDRFRLRELAECLRHYIGERYGLPVEVREPLGHALRGDDEAPGETVRVLKWRVSVVTAPMRPDLPKQRVNVEVANLPAYTREPMALRVNYDFLPGGYMDLLVPTERLEEVVADKLVSLVNSTRYLRHRDIWDLRWLGQRNVAVGGELIRRKVDDYGVGGYPRRARAMAERLPEIVAGSEFSAEMRRFTPSDIQRRTLDRDGFLGVLVREVGGMLEKAASCLEA
ncbi:MAG: nucleotidyl transferase AbiEii/AbiGii toxin family protein [Nitrococcus sp.]|nr:nucleotidyl transferase AbiEii/AbiGii toxin family protein [Nitrococcus sp.]